MFSEEWGRGKRDTITATLTEGSMQETVRNPRYTEVGGLAYPDFAVNLCELYE